MQHNDKYFAADEAELTAAYLKKKSSNWFTHLYHNRYLEKVKRSWMSYHGAYFSSGIDGHEIVFGGEQGELVNLAVNHYRNIAQHLLRMITSTRPAFQPRSANSDHKSQVQTYLAHGILEYYMREKKMERFIKTAVEYAIVLGSGYVKMEWDSTKGKKVDEVPVDEDEIASFNEEGEPLNENGRVLKPYPIYEGDVSFCNLSPYDVVFDNTKEDTTLHDWVLVRSFKNKFDIAAKYPEFDEEIRGIATKDKQQKGNRATLSYIDDTVDIPVYEFFHKKTESVPNGRYLLYLDSDIVLLDTPLPYEGLPIYRISPGDILGTPYGYTPMFDLLPLQDAVNSLYSTILTNQNAFGVQNILNPRGNDVSVSQLEGALNFIEYNPVPNTPNGGEPKALNLTNTPAEVFNFLQMLERAMETISGVNSVSRGNPEPSLRSGNALALVEAQSLQFISGLQQSYVQLVEDLGTGLVNMLKRFAKVPRMAEIAGKSNRSKMKEFTGEDLSSISRVIVDVGNPLAQTTSGRAEMASNLLQMGLVNSPEEYYAVLNTGKLEPLIQGQHDEVLLVRAENERLVDGTTDVIAIDTDDHALHIREHKTVLADPDARLDEELVARTLAHIQEHIDALEQVKPELLQIIGEQSIQPMQPPAQMPPQNPQAETGGKPTSLPGLPNMPKPSGGNQ